MTDMQIPIARKEGMVLQELPGEILIYDLKADKAHCLNETSAFVWKACDGKNTVADITKLLGSQSGSLIQEDLVWLAVDQLNENNLLEKEFGNIFNKYSRREVIKKIGLVAVIALPVVSILSLPQSALAVFCPTSVCSNDTGSGGCAGESCCNGQCVMPGTCVCG